MTIAIQSLSIIGSALTRWTADIIREWEGSHQEAVVFNRDTIHLGQVDMKNALMGPAGSRRTTTRLQTIDSTLGIHLHHLALALYRDKLILAEHICKSS
ncbi:HTH CENPB-type domain-containing protein [Mucor velutinosus]|uniref:HTH CENPB-type domain-containing protein n=1 Tax=Mucor velutinosus TaxID=708070 RepID=A0AAN7HYZ8_9FUNG|nr:HTH CENPB-type domain-containing protein [Mucor velutinosus]